MRKRSDCPAKVNRCHTLICYKVVVGKAWVYLKPPKPLVRSKYIIRLFRHQHSQNSSKGFNNEIDYSCRKTFQAR